MKTVAITVCILMFLFTNGYAAIPPVDSDYDSDVDGADLARYAVDFSVADPAADLDSSGVVDGDDANRFAIAFGKVEYFDCVYDVGPAMPYADPSAVPWESLTPGTLVRIHYREAPYAHKWVIAIAGSADRPVVVRGIPHEGRLPVIAGENATTRLELDYWNEGRSVVKVGGASHPSDLPSHIIIENLEIRSARPPYTFTDDSGNVQTYSDNAAAIHVEAGVHITIRNCILCDSGNGFFSTSQSADLLLEGNYIYGNGIENSIYQHNNYTESLGITFQYNHFGPLRAECRGNNLKDRSAGTVVRYNWIEAGNRTLDLVDSDYEDLIDDPTYRETFVYGNVLIKHDVVENSQVLHYGGDSGDTDHYRKGTLWFYNNTIISYRSGNTTLMGLSSNDEHAECFNNVVLATAGAGRLAILDAAGTIDLHHNWLTDGWVASHGVLEGDLTRWDNRTGSVPGFVDITGQDYRLMETSICVNAGDDLPANVLPDHDLAFQYVRHQRTTDRPRDGMIDMGAFEY
jgi:hypothetical protein